MPDFRADFGAIAPTKAEHDAIVERLGRPHDSDPPQVRRSQALAPDIAADARVFGVYVEAGE